MIFVLLLLILNQPNSELKTKKAEYWSPKVFCGFPGISAWLKAVVLSGSVLTERYVQK